jgi:hypothetical protein
MYVLDNINFNSFTFLTVEMTLKDMLDNKQRMIESLTLPFISAILKIPLNVKKMKWGEYLVCKIVHTFRECIYSIFSMSFYFLEIKKKSKSRNSQHFTR